MVLKKRKIGHLPEILKYNLKYFAVPTELKIWKRVGLHFSLYHTLQFLAHDLMFTELLVKFALTSCRFVIQARCYYSLWKCYPLPVLSVYVSSIYFFELK